MKDISTFINEAEEKTRWIAVEVVTRSNDSWDDGKRTRSQRVVSVDTYHDLKQGKTKGYREIISVSSLGPECSSKERAMDFLDSVEKTKKKGKVKKGDADYIVWAIGMGKMNPAGKTKWDWSIWDEWKDVEQEIYMLGGKEKKWSPTNFAFGAKGTLKEGDRILGVDNDTNKKLSGMSSYVKCVCKCNYEEFVKTFRENWPDVCKPRVRAFGKLSDGLPWATGAGRFGQMYSIKGVTDEDEV